MCDKSSMRNIIRKGKRMGDSRRKQLMQRVESLFLCYDGTKILTLMGELKRWGFMERDADPASIVLTHPEAELYLELGLTDEGSVHRYLLLPFESLHKKQDKYRW